MNLLSTWRELYTLRYCPVTLIQTAFSAGTVYILFAKKAISGTRTADKELRSSLDKKTLVQQYLLEVGTSWSCATKVSVTLGRLMKEHVRPLLDFKDRRNSATTSGLHISANMGVDEEEDGSSRSRSTSPKRSSKAPQISHPHTNTISSGFDQSSLPTSFNHVSTSPSSSQAPPPLTILSASSSNPSSFTDSRPLQHNPSSNSNFNYLSPAHPDFRYVHSFSSYLDNPFSGSGTSDDAEYAFGGPSSLSLPVPHNFQPFSGVGCLGMSGGQPLSVAPFFGVLTEVEDNHGPQAPIGNGFQNHESSSLLGELDSSYHGNNDNVDLDSAPWTHSFTS